MSVGLTLLFSPNMHRNLVMLYWVKLLKPGGVI